MKNVQFDPDVHTYIGRGPGRCHMMNTHPLNKGWLGNPVAVGYGCPQCGSVHRDGGSTLACYTILLKRRLKDSEFRKHFILCSKDKDFMSKDLVCWCSPNPCHGQILAKVFTYFSKMEA